MSTIEAGKKNNLPDFRLRFNELRGDMSQADFANKIGIARATVGLYENGNRIPDAYVLKQIAERCGVSADWLLGLSNDMKGNADITAVENRLGLTPNAQELLEASTHIKYGSDFINELICSKYFNNIILDICDYFNQMEERIAFEKAHPDVDFKPGSVHSITIGGNNDKRKKKDEYENGLRKTLRDMIKLAHVHYHDAKEEFEGFLNEYTGYK